MAKEPDNLVLVLLREMRATLETHATRFDAIDKRLEKMDKDNEIFKFQLTHVFGLSGMGNIHAQQADTKADAVTQRQTRLEAKVEEIDRRLKRVEEPA